VAAAAVADMPAAETAAVAELELVVSELIQV
jgi:hypothetical protein